MTEVIAAFEQSLLDLNRLEAKRLVFEALSRQSTLEFVENVLVKALERIGDGWKQGDIALSQVYMSGRICEELIDDLLPSADPRRKNQPPMAIAVLDDYHMLGKRIVYSVLRASGFNLKDYGRVTVDEVVQRVAADHIRVLLISTLMLPSALNVRNVVLRLKSAGLDVKVIVGGAPFIFDPQLWQTVHADAMGQSASEVVGLVTRMIGEIS